MTRPPARGRRCGLGRRRRHEELLLDVEQHHRDERQHVQIRADPSGRLAWEQAEYSAPAGDVTFVGPSVARVEDRGVVVDLDRLGGQGHAVDRAVLAAFYRAVRDEWGEAQGLSLQTPIVVKYRDEKTDASTALEQWLR